MTDAICSTVLLTSYFVFIGSFQRGLPPEELPPIEGMISYMKFEVIHGRHYPNGH